MGSPRRPRVFLSSAPCGTAPLPSVLEQQVPGWHTLGLGGRQEGRGREGQGHEKGKKSRVEVMKGKDVKRARK